MTQVSPSQAAMNVAEIMRRMEEEREQSAEKSQTDRHVFMQRFCKLMIDHVLIEFSGSGDSGNVDVIQISYVEGHGPSEAKKEESEKELIDELDTWTYEYLAGVGVDWYNNEGGQGQIEFDMRHPPFTFKSNVDVNYTESKTEHSCEEVL